VGALLANPRSNAEATARVTNTKTKATTALYNKEFSASFYEERYAQGYMDEWPHHKKQRVYEVIRQLPLPEQGQALDFGCGNGVFTEVIRQALPKWQVFGTDLSKTAVRSAKERYPHCHFFEPEDKNDLPKHFDFLFSHHVIEHVYDVSEVLQQMNEHLKPRASMLHILPCGNPGSLSHTICSLRKDGIDASCGNRFFFEDEGHVRRLTTQELSSECKALEFGLVREFYSGSYHDAIEWITSNNLSFIRILTDSNQAIHSDAKRQLDKIRKKLLTLGVFRAPARNLPKLRAKHKPTFSQYVLMALLLPLYPASKLFENHLIRAARKEWLAQKHESRGGEMSLYLERPAGNQ
jgi:trans-aconitate methyltransferase